MLENFSYSLYDDDVIIIIGNKKRTRNREGDSTHYMFTDVLNISNIEDRSQDQSLSFIIYNG
jgi:hypothetical protein